MGTKTTKNYEKDVSIIIVSYNCRIYLEKCLQSIKKDIVNSGLDIEVIVVDNDSKDGTRNMFDQKKFQWVNWVAAKNNGYGAGNNIGMKMSRGKYIFVLNPDTEIKNGFLWKMFRYMEEHRDVGVVGPRVVYGDNSLQISAYDNFPGLISAILENTLMDRLFYYLFPYWIYPGKLFSRKLHNKEREVKHLLGAALFFRNEVYDMIGGFDERFFLYREETDWQYRIRIIGWKIVFYPKATVIHYEGVSTGQAWSDRKWMSKLDVYLPSVYKYHMKWQGWFYMWVVMMIYFLGSIFTMMILCLIFLFFNTIGWLIPGLRKKIMKSISSIVTYHLAIVIWHIKRWVKNRSVLD